MFPIRGSFGGPGGNLEYEDFGFVEFHIRRIIMNKKMKNKNMGDETILGSSSMIAQVIFEEANVFIMFIFYLFMETGDLCKTENNKTNISNL